MWSKLAKVSGLVFIIGFSSLSIGVFQLSREFGEVTWVRNLTDMLKYSFYLEDRFYDIRMNFSMDKTKTDNRLVLAAIDDLALNNIGRWPWGRKTWSPIMSKIKHFGAKVVSFDVVFSEEEKACNMESPDALLAKSIADFQSKPGNSVIVPYSLASIYRGDDDIAAETLPDELYNAVMNVEGDSERNAFEVNRLNKTTIPINKILAASPSMAYINAQEDLDGIFRRYKLVSKIDGLFFPSYALQSYQNFTGDAPTLSLDPIGNGVIKFKNGKMHLNTKGETKIRWLGGSEVFPTISIYDIQQASLDDEKMHKMFKDKLVFIGSTAFAAHDIRHTPVDAKLPGVYFHMNMVNMLLEGRYFQPLDKSLFWSWGILIVGTLLTVVISLLGHAIIDAFITIIFCGAALYFDTYHLLPGGHEVSLFFALFSVIGSYSWLTLINFYAASKDKAFLKSAFGNYISPELIDQMYESGEPPKLGGDVGVRTAYFTDIQSFSTFSEKLSAPQLVELLNEYLTAMTDILLKHQGTLDKYEGDAIIAFFGAPLPLEDHADRALLVADEMQNKLLELREKWTSEGDKWPKIVHDMKMRIGINSGEIVTGNMGSKTRMNYTMMGDSVNLAARLEEAAKQYGIFTQISEYTTKLTSDKFELRELDTIRVVGKSEPVTTYDLLGIKGKLDDNLAKLKENFHKGIELYKNQKWDEAIATFNISLECELKRFPDLANKANPSKIYIERCEEFKKSPPPADWDGVYTLTSK